MDMKYQNKKSEVFEVNKYFNKQDNKKMRHFLLEFL